MTVTATTSRISYAGNGSTTTFAVPFYFLANADLVLIKTTAAGVQTTLTLTTDYSVTGAGVLAGGSVTLVTAPAATETLVIYRDPAVTQAVDYQPNDPFPAETHERALDKLTMIGQRLKDLVSRSFRLSDGDTTTASTTLPSPSSNKLIGWNASATGLQNVDQSTLATIVAFGTANADVFTGNGVQTAFTLSSNPGAQANLDVSVGGVTQTPGTHYNWASGTTVTFTAAPPNGVTVLIRYFQALPQGATDSAASTFLQAGTNAQSTNVQRKLREAVSVFDFMTATQVADVQAGTVAVDVAAAIQAAIDSISNDGIVLVPPGTYRLTAGLTLGALNKGARLIGIGKPTLKFYSLGASTDGITIPGANYRQTQLENLFVDMNNTGRDGVRLNAGDRPLMRNVTVQNTIQDGFSFVCSGTYDWIENAQFEQLLVNNAGRHAFYLEASGLYSFINESGWKQCECRGVSLKTNNGAAIYAKNSGTASGSKMSELQWIDCNFDAMRQSAITNGFDVNPNPVVLSYTAGGQNSYESWTIIGGGWETTTGGPDYRASGLVKLESGASARGWLIKFGSPGGWSGGGLNGKFADYFLHDKQSGTVRAPMPNSWKQQAFATSSTANIDIPIPLVHRSLPTRIIGGNWYEVAIWGYQYSGTGQESWKNDLFMKYYGSGADAYWFQFGTVVNTLIGSDQFTVNSITVLNSALGATLNDANPPAYVRINVTTTANWASGGGDNILHGVVALKGSTHGEFAA